MPNFFVLSSARSGSSLFSNYLSAHHDVKCWGEILNPESGINPEVGSLTGDGLLEFVNSILSCAEGQWVGAKIHTHQLYELPISLSAALECADRPQILVIFREAMLDTYVSLQIALRNNVWYSTNVVNDEKIKIEWTHF